MVVIQLIFIEITGTALLWLKNFFELRPVFENYGDRRLCVIILYNFTRQIWRRWGNTTRLYLLFDVSTSITGIRQKKLVLVLSVLDRTRTCRVKKAVICVTELMAALIPICGLLLLLLSLDDTLNMHSFCSASKESWGSEGAAGASTRTRTTISGWKSNTGCCMCSIFLSLLDISGAWKHVSVYQSNVGRW